MKGYRTGRTYYMHLQGTPEQVFPLLCPVREYEWIDGWKCDVIYSESGVAELNCVFKTSFPEDGPEDTWVISRYEPPALIEFVRINTHRVLTYSMSLERKSDGTTGLNWMQYFTGLTPEGNDFIKGLSQEAYCNRMAAREKQLNHFLLTGKMFK